MVAVSQITDATFRASFQDGVSAGAAAATDGMKKLGAATQETQTRVTRATPTLEQLNKRLDENAKLATASAAAEKRFSDAVNTLTREVQAGNITQAQAFELERKAAVQRDQSIEKARRAADAQRAMYASANQSAAGLRAMNASANDNVTAITASTAAISKMRSVLGTLGVALSVGGLVAFTKHALDVAGGLGELADQLGVTTQQLQVYQFAGAQSGLEAEGLNGALQKLSRTVGDAASGQDQAVKSFQQFGIAFRDVNGQALGTSQVLGLIADRIKGAKDPSEQAAIAFEFLGRSGQKLIPLLKEGSAGLGQWEAAARGAGAVLDDDLIGAADKASDSLRGMTDALSRAGQRVVAEFAPAITKAAIWVTENIDTLGRAAEVAGLALGVFAATSVVTNIGAIAGAIAGATRAALLFTAALAVNPIGLIAVGISAAVAAMIFFRDETFNLGEMTVRVGDVMAAVWESVWQPIKATVLWIGNLSTILSRFITGDFAGAAAAVKNGADIIRNAGSEIGAAWSRVGEEVPPAQEKVAQGTKDMAAAAAGAIPLTNQQAEAVAKLKQTIADAGLAMEKARAMATGGILAAAEIEDAKKADAALRDLAKAFDMTGASLDAVAAKAGITRQQLVDAFAGQRMGEAAQKVQEFRIETEREVTAIDGQITALAGSAAARTEANDQAKIADELAKFNVKSGSDEARIITDVTRALQSKNRELENAQRLQDLSTELDRVNRQSALSGLTGRARAEQEAALSKEYDLRKRNVERTSAQATEEIRLAKEIAGSRAAFEEIDRVAQRTTDNIVDSFADMLTGGKNAFKSLKDFALAMFKEIAANSLIRPIIAPIVQGATSALSGLVSGASAAAGGAAGGSLMSGAAGAGAGLAAMGGSLSTTLFGSASSFAAGGAAYVPATSGLIGSGGTFLGSAGAASGITNGLGGLSVLGAGLAGYNKDPVSGIVSGIGAYLAFGPWGAAAAAVAALVGFLMAPKPSNKFAGGAFDGSAGTVTPFDGPANERDQGNMTFRDASLQLLQSIAGALKGPGVTQPNVNLNIGSRDGYQYTIAGNTVNTGSDQAAYTLGLMKDFVANMTGVSESLKNIVAASTDAATALDDLAFAQGVIMGAGDRMKAQLDPTAAQIDALTKAYTANMARATALGLTEAETADYTREYNLQLQLLNGTLTALPRTAGTVGASFRKLGADLASSATELANQWRAVKTTLSGANDNLLLGDASTLDPIAKQAEANRQFQSVLAKARGGDVASAQQLPQIGETLLKLSRDIYASSPAYVSVFETVRGALTEIGTSAGTQAATWDQLATNAVTAGNAFSNVLRIVGQALEDSILTADEIEQIQAGASAVTTAASLMGPAGLVFTGALENLVAMIRDGSLDDGDLAVLQGHVDVVNDLMTDGILSDDDVTLIGGRVDLVNDLLVDGVLSEADVAIIATYATLVHAAIVDGVLSQEDVTQILGFTALVHQALTDGVLSPADIGTINARGLAVKDALLGVAGTMNTVATRVTQSINTINALIGQQQQVVQNNTRSFNSGAFAGTFDAGSLDASYGGDFMRWIREYALAGNQGEAATRLAQSGQAFDGARYLALNTDVAASGMEPLQHFLQYGIAEGRKFANGGFLPYGKIGLAGETGRAELIMGPAYVANPDVTSRLMGRGANDDGNAIALRREVAELKKEMARNAQATVATGLAVKASIDALGEKYEEQTGVIRRKAGP